MPTKLLVPILEAGSLEDPDDEEMHELWANLLAVASSKLSIEPRFPSILKELQSRQAKLLERIAKNSAPADKKIWCRDLCDAPVSFDSYQLTDQLDQLHNSATAHATPEEIFDTMLGWLESPGCAPVDVIVSLPEKDQPMWSLSSAAGFGGGGACVGFAHISIARPAAEMQRRNDTAKRAPRDSALLLFDGIGRKLLFGL